MNSGPAGDCLQYADTDCPVDCQRAIDGASFAQSITCVTGTGTVTVKTKKSGAQTRTWNLSPGDKVECQIRSVDSTSGITAFRLAYPDE